MAWLKAIIAAWVACSAPPPSTSGAPNSGGMQVTSGGHEVGCARLRARTAQAQASCWRSPPAHRSVEEVGFYGNSAGPQARRREAAARMVQELSIRERRARR